MYLKSLATALSSALIALSFAACTPTGRTELLPVEGDAFVGPADAKVVVVEYGSPTCPACKGWHDTNYPMLKADYVDTGKVKFVFREFAIHGAVDANIFAVARCAGQKDFFAVLDEAFLRQNDIVQASMKGGDESKEEIYALGEKFQLNREQVKSCSSDKTIIGRINDVKADAANKGIDSTPTFMVDTVVLADNTWPTVKAAIDAALGAGAAPASAPLHGPDEPH